MNVPATLVDYIPPTPLRYLRTARIIHPFPTALNVADTVLFLASPAAAAITGQCLNVDCGTLPQ